MYNKQGCDFFLGILGNPSNEISTRIFDVSYEIRDIHNKNWKEKLMIDVYF